MNANRRRIIEAQLDRAAAIAVQHGVRLTELCRLVLGLILEADGPLTAYQLLDRLKPTRRSAVPPTVYRALDFLLAQRLIHKIERINAFIACVDGGHPHPAQFLICGSCGAVTEIEDRTAATALEHAAAAQGFRARNTVVEIEGTCAACFDPA